MTMTQSPPRSAGVPTVDPRLKQRWIEARRQEGRRRLRVLVAIVAVAALVIGALGVVHSPLLRVRHVRVRGLAHLAPGATLSRSQVVAQAGLAHRTLMVDVDTTAEERLIEQLPWVATASVARQWPGTIRIAVTTRTAVAEVPQGRGGRELALVDGTGRILAEQAAGGSAAPALPVLAGASAGGAPGSWMPSRAQPGVSALLRAAAALPPRLAARVSNIRLGPNGLDLEVGSTTVVFGSTAELAEKVPALETILAHVNLSHIRQVDLRVPDRPALSGAARSRP